MAKTGKSSERADAGLIAELALALSDERLRHITGQVYTASGHRLARWSNPFEASEVTFGDDWAADDVLQALDLRLGWQPLRRFAALGLTLPSAASRPSTASAR
jgi:hypothetical protein